MYDRTLCKQYLLKGLLLQPALINRSELQKVPWQTWSSLVGPMWLWHSDWTQAAIQDAIQQGIAFQKESEQWIILGHGAKAGMACNLRLWSLWDVANNLVARTSIPEECICQASWHCSQQDCNPNVHCHENLKVLLLFRAVTFKPHCHLWANYLDNVGSSTSHNLLGLHSLLQGQLYFYFLQLNRSNYGWVSYLNIVIYVMQHKY
jgi:hypothetical protein